MSTELPFGSNTINTYVYESFSYTISNPNPSLYTLSTTNTPGILPGYLTNNGSNVIFAGISNAMSAGTESFTVTATDGGGNIAGVSSNVVKINVGRFTDPSGNTYVGSNFVFYENEPITPIRLLSPFQTVYPFTKPTLPPGLGFIANGPTEWDIMGTPRITAPTSNYLITANGTTSNSSKIVSTNFNLTVSNERIRTDLSGSPIVNMVVDTPIVPRVVTANFAGTGLNYVVSGLPDGIYVTDNSGNIPPNVFQGFFPTDPSYTMIITGTPTVAGALAFKNAGLSNAVITVNTSGIGSNLRGISSSFNMTFGFGETVLFDPVTIPTLYKDVPLDPSANFYRAATYFSSGAAITSIAAASLPTGLSLTPVVNGVSYLTGTPTVAGTGTYTITATNSNAFTRDLSSTITVVQDTVSFVSPPTAAVDTCYNFVLSRPLDASLTGYYPSPIQIRAVAASGSPITWSIPAFSGTGIGFDICGNTITLAGVPNTVTSLSTMAVTANATQTPATATRNFKFAILNDVITVSDVSAGLFQFFQNRTITPIQFSATTLSARPISSFSATGLPAGVSISPSGLLTGKPTGDTSGTMTVIASTGYTFGSKAFDYNVVRDNMVIAMANGSETVGPIFSGVDFRAVTYSGTPGTLSLINSQVVPYQFDFIDLSMTSAGIMSGNLSNSSFILPEYRIPVYGAAGNYNTNVVVDIAVSNSPTPVGLMMISTDDPSPSGIPPLPPNTARVQVFRTTDASVQFSDMISLAITPTKKTWTSVLDVCGVTWGRGTYDMAQDSSRVIAIAGSNIYRSLDDGATWSTIPSSNITKLSGVLGPYLGGIITPSNPIFSTIATDGSSNWVALGLGSTGTTNYTIVRRSTDGGTTWTDTSINQLLNPPGQDSRTRMIYNNGRYILTQETSPYIAYAASSNPIQWSNALVPLVPGAPQVRGIAANGNTLVAVGTSNMTNKGLVSIDNGLSWSALPADPVPSIGGELVDVQYSEGYWTVIGQDTGSYRFSYSTDLSNWTVDSQSFPNQTWRLLDDGLSRTSVGDLDNARLWQAALPSSLGFSNSTFTITASPSISFNSMKRVLGRKVDNGPVTATIRILYDISGMGWAEPVSSSFTEYQYTTIDPIPIRAIVPTDAFTYYYTTTLPDGLSLVLDPSGISAQITGRSMAYSDALVPVTLIANHADSKIITRIIGIRTVLPNVYRNQTSAGAWTSLTRQYTQVNAAQNARDNRTFPQVNPILGEFTSPGAPDVITKTYDDCHCKTIG